MIKKNKIYNVDCIDWMKSASKEIDLVVTSPPYNTLRPNLTDRGYDLYKDGMSNKEYIDWSLEIFKGFDKVLKKNGVVLYNMNYGTENTTLMSLVIADIIKKSHFTLADIIVWKKNSATPNNMSSNKMTRIVEYVYVFCRKDEFYTFNCNKKELSKRKKGQSVYENVFNFITAKNNDGSNNLNKATFSTDFCRQLLMMYGHKNCLVYDSFMGTGTTAESCIIEDMNYVGTELSESQCRFAEKRLGIRISQPKLF